MNNKWCTMKSGTLTCSFSDDESRWLSCQATPSLGVAYEDRALACPPKVTSRTSAISKSSERVSKRTMELRWQDTCHMVNMCKCMAVYVYARVWMLHDGLSWQLGWKNWLRLHWKLAPLNCIYIAARLPAQVLDLFISFDGLVTSWGIVHTLRKIYNIAMNHNPMGHGITTSYLFFMHVYNIADQL